MKKILSLICGIAFVLLLGVTAAADDACTVNIYIGNLNAPYGKIWVEDEQNNKTEAERSGSGSTKPFVYTLNSGNYSYVIADASGNEKVRGAFSVDAGGTLNIYLKRVDFEFDCYNINSEEYPDCGAAVVMKTPDGKEISGTKSASGAYFTADGKQTERWSFTLEAKGNEYKYSYEITMNDSGLLLTEGEATGELSYNASKTTVRNAATVTVTPAADFNAVIFKVTKGAGMGLYKKTDGHYSAFYKYEEESIDTDSDADYDIYTYHIPKKASGRIHMVAGGSEGEKENIQSVIFGESESWQARYLKTARIFDVSKLEAEYTVDVEKLDNSDRRDCIYTLGGGAETVEADMFLNVPDNNYINIDIADPSFTGSYELRAYRVNQAQYGAVSNYFIEPDFHYEVVAGSSVTVSPSYSQITGMPTPGDEYAVVTPVDMGVSIIKITYDAMSLEDGRNGKAYFNAVDPLNVRYVVVNVTEGAAEEIKSGIALREYDTVYYTKSTVLPDGTKQNGTEYAEFTFTPESGSSVSVNSPLKGTDWMKYTANEDGSFSVRLFDGENIIRIAKEGAESYYVVSAKGITVRIANKTADGNAITVGDTVRISFEGLNLPNKKLAAVYNPGYPDTTWVHYSCDSALCTQSGMFSFAADGVVRGRGAQYVVASEKFNGIEFTVLKAGTIVLTEGKIHSEHMGSPLGAHRLLNGTGLKPNLDADNNSENAEFSVLPNISVTVGEEQKPAPAEEPRGEASVIRISAVADAAGEQNPNTGAAVR